MDRLLSRFLRQFSNFPPPLAVFFLTLLVYGITAVPDLTWAFHSGDGGELITAVMTGGIPHPPGYPTYLLLGKLAAQLPITPIAYRFNLFSAVCGATAAAMTSATARLLGLSGWQSVLPGLTLAFVPLVWQQAVITEVYALNLALISLFVWSLVGKRPPWLVGLLLGLSLTTHLTSVLLLPLALLLMSKRQWPQLTAGILLGLIPFFLLPWLAQSDSPVVWGNLQTVSGWWWLVSAQIYRPNQLALPVAEWLPRLKSWGLLFLKQLLFVGWLLLGWGIWHEEKKKIGVTFTGTAVLYFIYAFLYNTTDSIVLTLPAWCLLSLALAPGFKRVRFWGILLPLASVLLNFGLINSAEIHNIRPFAEQIINRSPPNAILITSGDPDIFALWYFHLVEGQRPDLIVVDDQLFAFEWYRNRLQARYPRLQGIAEDNLPAFRTANANKHPICTVAFREGDELAANNSCIEEP